MLLTIVVAGTIAYSVLGLNRLDALYMTVTTVSTVGFREVGDVDDRYQVVTVALILLGTSTALYTFGVVMEGLFEGRLRDLLGRRRMTRDIARMRGHIVICGGGRVGRELVTECRARSRELVVIDTDAAALERFATDMPFVTGDATSDAVLREAGVERAEVLFAALSTDADNVYVILAARSMNPDLFIVARAHDLYADAKLVQAGADRVVNPQFIGGRRMATYALNPNVADFLDVVVEEAGVEWQLNEIVVSEGSPYAGLSLADADIRNSTGALVLALRDADGEFVTNPGRDEVLMPGSVVIAIGTPTQLAALARAQSASERRTRRP